MLTFLSHQFVHLKLTYLIDPASAKLLIEIKPEKVFFGQNETNSNVNHLIFAKCIVNSDTIVKEHVGTTVFGTKNSKTTGNIAKVVSEKQKKKKAIQEYIHLATLLLLLLLLKVI